ncbi:hypothetical protein GCM10020295_45830 [Streptomyces cinereospinus]
MAEGVHAVLSGLGIRPSLLGHGDDASRSQRRFPRLLVERRTPDVPAARPGEDEPLGHRRAIGDLPRQGDLDRREPLHVGPKRISDRAGKRHVPQLAALRWREHGLAAAQLQLLDHVERVRLEVDRVDGHAQDLALAEPAAAAQVDHGLVTLGHGGPDGEDPLGRPRHDALVVDGRRPDRPGGTRVAGKVPVVHSRAERRPHVGVDRPGVRPADAVLLQLPHPVPDVCRLEGAERT